MSRRLQVLMPEAEYRKLQATASSLNLPVGEFVRRELRRSCEILAAKPAEEKLRAISRALQYGFPTADIEQMNAEIEQGRKGPGPWLYGPFRP